MTKTSNTLITGRVIKVRNAKDLEDRTHTLITLFANGAEKEQIIFNFKIKDLYEGHKINIEYGKEKKYLRIMDIDKNKVLYDGKYYSGGTK